MDALIQKIPTSEQILLGGDLDGHLGKHSRWESPWRERIWKKEWVIYLFIYFDEKRRFYSDKIKDTISLIVWFYLDYKKR